MHPSKFPLKGNLDLKDHAEVNSTNINVIMVVSVELNVCVVKNKLKRGHFTHDSCRKKPHTHL